MTIKRTPRSYLELYQLSVNCEGFLLYAVEAKRSTIALRYRLGIITVIHPRIYRRFNDFVLKFYHKHQHEYSFILPMTEEYYYYFGQKYSLRGSSMNQIMIYLKKQLKIYIDNRVIEIIAQFQLPFPIKIVYKDLLNKWASFHRKEKGYFLTFSNNLIFYHKELIDSVIFHELAHYYQMNHSKEFYRILKQFDPLYKEHHRDLINGKYNLHLV